MAVTDVLENFIILNDICSVLSICLTAECCIYLGGCVSDYAARNELCSWSDAAGNFRSSDLLVSLRRYELRSFDCPSNTTTGVANTLVGGFCLALSD